jgi:hypothetical protein
VLNRVFVDGEYSSSIDSKLTTRVTSDVKEIPTEGLRGVYIRSGSN